jgi:hypothetical protein
MKATLRKLSGLPLVIMLMAACMTMTSQIESNSMLIESGFASDDFSIFAKADSWTWSDFAGAAVVGGVAGAAGGAAAGALACGVGAGPGAVAGGVGGVVGGAVGYAGMQAWNYFFGEEVQSLAMASYSEIALD